MLINQGNTAFGAVPLEIEPLTLAEATNDSPIRPIGVGAYHPGRDRATSGASTGLGLGLDADVRSGRGRRAGRSAASVSVSASPEKRSDIEGEETMEIEDDD
jgi:hypothetical protein